MKRMFLTMAVAGAASAALANEKIEKDPSGVESPEARSVDKGPSQPDRFLIRAPVVDPGETLQLGDILTVTRGFGSWSLGCSVRISTGRRSCSIEQVVVDADAEVGTRSSVKWGIGSNIGNKSMLFVQVTSNLMQESGMRLSFAGVEKTIPQQDWFCSDKGCISSFPFEGIVQSGIQSTETIGFAFKVKSTDGQVKDVSLDGHMGGFDKALKIAATNPFANIVVATPKTNDAKKAAAKPKAATEGSKKQRGKPHNEAQGRSVKATASGLY
ncbi:invasion associated locus B family protein [Agrobacterium tumefaciens]|uniref:invasion associated locus B family protein n=1 Tax=Agrobacterium tumefaciens TaxID=358 RepID=UPI0021D3DDB9|nr:invasion associated locus B family protein [Agrobacterium tumefaciens]UXS05563.1 invasion associated locus B family protein [Agrobacterium tumefaciens]